MIGSPEGSPAIAEPAIMAPAATAAVRATAAREASLRILIPEAFIIPTVG
jgi:hypothetical protein